MKKVIVTGATGMIGINLIKYLLEKDIEVLAIIRKKSSKKKYLTQMANLKIIECNLEELKDIRIEEKYDTFIHLAWDGTFGDSRNDVRMQLKNIEYTLDAVRLAKRIGCAKFIGAGSQAEYGRVEKIITPSTPTNPENGYGIAKLCAGKLSRLLCAQLGIEHIWTRILSVYGPHDNDNTMVMLSIKEMLENNTSPAYTKAEQIWDYIYVEDVAEVFCLIGEYGKNNAIYCIGSGEQRPLYQYIQEIRDNIDKDIELNIGAIEYSNNQVMNLCADISNLTEDTGFVPKTNFKEGIIKTIKYYKENLYEEKN